LESWFTYPKADYLPDTIPECYGFANMLNFVVETFPLSGGVGDDGLVSIMMSCFLDGRGSIPGNRRRFSHIP
jgi:hypothetical protein